MMLDPSGLRINAQVPNRLLSLFLHYIKEHSPRDGIMVRGGIGSLSVVDILVPTSSKRGVIHLTLEGLTYPLHLVSLMVDDSNRI